MSLILIRCPGCGQLAELYRDGNGLRCLRCRHCGHRAAPWRETPWTADAMRRNRHLRQTLLRRR